MLTDVGLVPPGPGRDLGPDLHLGHDRHAEGRDDRPRQPARDDGRDRPRHPAARPPVVISVLPLSHLFEQAIGLIYALSVGADILYVRSRNPRVLFAALQAHRVTSMILVPAGARPVLERDRARGRPERPPRALRPPPVDRPPSPLPRPSPDLPERPRPARRQPEPVRQLGRVPSACPPAGLGGPRRRRRPGLRQQRERVRDVHDPRGPRPRDGRPADAARSSSRSPTTARSSSAARPSSRATGRTPMRPPGRWTRTAGTTPATSAISTPVAAWSSAAGRRTGSSCRTASRSTRRTSRTRCAWPASATRSSSRRTPGRIEAIVLLRGVGVETAEAAKPVMDAAVREANARLGPQQRIAAWRLWPEDDFPRTHTLKVRRDPVRAWLEG